VPFVAVPSAPVEATATATAGVKRQRDEESGEFFFFLLGGTFVWRGVERSGTNIVWLCVDEEEAMDVEDDDE
jgi:hypothetical protein